MDSSIQRRLLLAFRVPSLLEFADATVSTINVLPDAFFMVIWTSSVRQRGRSRHDLIVVTVLMSNAALFGTSSAQHGSTTASCAHIACLTTRRPHCRLSTRLWTTFLCTPQQCRDISAVKAYYLQLFVTEITMPVFEVLS